MRSSVELWRSRARLSIATSAVVALAALTWGFWPLSPPPLPTVAYRPVLRASQADTERDRLSAEAFDVDLWIPRHEEPAAPEPSVVTAPSPVPNLRLELIGVTERNGRRIAAIYDRAADRMRLVADGESIAELSVSVEPRRVRLGPSGEQVVLALREASK